MPGPTQRGFALREGWQQGGPATPNTAQTSPSGPIVTAAPTIVQQAANIILGPAIPGVNASIIDVPSPDQMSTDPIVLAQYTVALLGLLQDILVAEIPQGIVTESVVNVNSNTPFQTYFQPPLFGILLTNDGPDPIQFQVPISNRSVWVTLNNTEQRSYTFKTGVITGIQTRWAAGSSAATSLRVEGYY